MPVIARHHNLAAKSPLVLLTPRALFYSYRFTGVSGMRDLARFVFPQQHTPELLAPWDKLILDATYVPGQPMPPTPTGATVVVFGEKLQIIEILHAP